MRTVRETRNTWAAMRRLHFKESTAVTEKLHSPNKLDGVEDLQEYTLRGGVEKGSGQQLWGGDSSKRYELPDAEDNYSKAKEEEEGDICDKYGGLFDEIVGVFEEDGCDLYLIVVAEEEDEEQYGDNEKDDA
ncbi:unnamed protein product [Sphagnum balticum]